MWVFILLSLCQGPNVYRQLRDSKRPERKNVGRVNVLLLLMELGFHLTGEKHAWIQHIQAQLYLPLVFYQGCELYKKNKRRFILFALSLTASIGAGLVDGIPYYTPGFDPWKSPGINDPHFVQAHYVIHLASLVIDGLYTQTCIEGR